jgi:Rrf2 family protein
VPANEIANEMQTPPFLLSRILQVLTRSEFLLSMKGHHGGFKLRKRPEEISIQEIIHLIDGPFVVHECVGNCGLSPDCSLRNLFAAAEESLEAVFARATLAEMCRPRQRNGSVVLKNPSVFAAGVD